MKTNACCASGAPPTWIASRLSNVHPELANRFYGCGYPIPHALDGATVLDLGSIGDLTDAPRRASTSPGADRVSQKMVYVK